MRARNLICSLVMVLSLYTGEVLGAVPVAVSPGIGSGIAVITQECPTFSWSQVEGAVSYRLKVFERANGEILSCEEMERTAEPLMSIEIKAPALSWTPSAGECFGTGTGYVWYVGAISGTKDPEPVEVWSAGKSFEVDLGASVGLRDALKETMKEYLTTEWISTESYQEVKESIKRETVKEIKDSGGKVIGSGIPVALATEGPPNTIYGSGAGAGPPSGAYNTFIGVNAGHGNTTAGNNTFVGESAGYSTISGNENTFIGSWTGYMNAGGYYNTSVGSAAGYNNTDGYENTFVGHSAGHSNTGGDYNTFLGRNAGYSNTNPVRNTFVGYSAGYMHTMGDFNTFVGNEAGYTNTTGYSNTFFGSSAGSLNSTGNGNVFLGALAGYFHQAGSLNTFVGNEAGYRNQTGDNNTFLGWRAGYESDAGAGNVFIGYQTGYNETGSNKLYIANSDTSTPLIYGEFDSNLVRIHGTLQVASALSPSDERLKRDIQPLEQSLEKLTRLQGVHYSWRTEEYPGRGLKEGTQVGLIAQEVEKIFPELVHTGSDGYKAIDYQKLVPVLIEALKEQGRMLQAQQADINELKATMMGIK